MRIPIIGHIIFADTIKSGQGLCNEKLSAILCEGAVDRILEMKEWKTNWAHTNNKMIQVMAPSQCKKMLFC